MKEVVYFIEYFRNLWDERFNKLEAVMKKHKIKKIKYIGQKKINIEDDNQEIVHKGNFIYL